MPLIEIPKPRLDEKRSPDTSRAYVTHPNSVPPWWEQPEQIGAAAVIVVFLVIVTTLLVRVVEAPVNRIKRQYSAPELPALAKFEESKIDEALWQKAMDIADRREPPLPMPEYFEIHLALIVAVAIVVFCSLAGIDLELHPTSFVVTAGLAAAIPMGMQYYRRRRNKKELTKQYHELLRERQRAEQAE